MAMHARSGNVIAASRPRVTLSHHNVLVLVAMSASIAASAPAALAADMPAAVVFKTKCASCHSYGQGDRVGPDLKGVTTRHPRSWLIAWIRSSETQIRSGDTVAVALFQKYRQQRMPDHDLSQTQISALLDYLEAGGPLAEESRLALAADAKADTVELGRRLFFGESRFAAGSVACVFCHSLSRATRLGGTLATDLGDVYSRYLDWALDRRLHRYCLPGATPSSASRVDDRESLALRAYLRVVGSVHVSGGLAVDRSTNTRAVSAR
jgi:mono/diheme cytochrome c family protein